MSKCPLCDREMIPGPSVDQHHLVPKCEGGSHGDKELCHVICHRKIHATLTEVELANYYYTWDRLREHPRIQRFVTWVQKKHPEYIDTHKRGSRLLKRHRIT